MDSVWLGQEVRIKDNAFGGEAAEPEDKALHGQIVTVTDLNMDGTVEAFGMEGGPIYLTLDEIEEV